MPEPRRLTYKAATMVRGHAADRKACRDECHKLVSDRCASFGQPSPREQQRSRAAASRDESASKSNALQRKDICGNNADRE